jgi:hypothetical protein
MFFLLVCYPTYDMWGPFGQIIGLRSSNIGHAEARTF